MKQTKTIIAAMIAALALAGCGAAGGSADTTETKTETKPACVVSDSTISETYKACTIELPDTRLVTCMVYDGYYSGGIDCDWAHVSGADMGTAQ